MFEQADVIPFTHQESEEKESHELLFCSYYDSLQRMGTITPARQDASENRFWLKGLAAVLLVTPNTRNDRSSF